jgi:predicted DCC family thiol-disulfide oxidoreductase YuxK
MTDNPSPTRDKPLVVFDGHCGFCRIWIDYWRERTVDRVDYVRYQETDGAFSSDAVHLATPTGEVWSGARAVYQLLTYSHQRTWLLRCYSGLPGFARLSEFAYRFIARHRSIFYWITVLLFGRRIHPASYRGVEWLFLRLLAVCYLAAFASFGVQVRGLIGSHGILPAADYLEGASQYLGAAKAWRVLPSLFWLSHSDAALTLACIAGAVVALVLLFGRFQRTCLVLLFVLYLSLCSVGQDFMSFQWDMLLLEAGFLASFLGSSHTVVWLFRLLVFRLMFSSGAIKLLSGDPTWKGLRALSFHYFTQPLPTPLAWYMQPLPDWIQKYCTAGALGIELAAPFLIFLPRRLRLIGASILILLQVLIMTTGNYAFFNWLTIALCLFLLDDGVLPRWIPRNSPGKAKTVASRRFGVAFTVLIAGLGTLQLYVTLTGRVPVAAAPVLRLVQPFGIVNRYGLFAVMTTTRIEITVQGSNDGANWLDYEFKYKPGPLNRNPPWVAPHQPRLDWQMWFAALSDTVNDRWFVGFAARLLEGSPDVAGLLGKNPFPNAPPRYIRALKSTYHFTNPSERRKTGNWWTADPTGVYFPAISLRDR